jgi:hypothetical protein
MSVKSAAVVASSDNLFVIRIIDQLIGPFSTDVSLPVARNILL